MMRVLLSALLVATALAGCLEGADDASGSGDEAEPADDLVSQADNRTNAAPVVDLAVDVLNGTAPLNVTFALDASDADGDNLTWSFDAGDDNTTANGTVLPATVNVTYLAGNWSAVFEVSDGLNTTVQVLDVTVAAVNAAAAGPAGPALPLVLSIEDPSGDAVGPATDLVAVDYEVNEDRLIAVMHISQMLPHDTGDSPFLYQFVIDGIRLEAYLLGGAAVWNNDADDAADADVTWDPASNTVTIDVSRTYIDGQGASFPYAVHNRAMVGEGFNGGVQEADRAPDADDVMLG